MIIRENGYGCGVEGEVVHEGALSGSIWDR